jgi:hypothetical protein
VPTEPAPRPASAGGWTLRRRLVATYLVAAVVMLLAAGSVSGCVVRLNDAIRSRSDVLAPTQSASSDLLASLVDQETGVRGYLLRGTADYLTPYNEGRTTEARLRARLTTLVAERPDLAAPLAELSRQADDWHRLYAEPAINAVRTGGVGAAAGINQESGKARFDDVRAAGTRFQDATTAASVAARQDVSNALRVLIVLLAVVALGLVALLALIARALWQWVTIPLNTLGRDVRRVAAGTLDHPIAPVGPPDVAALAEDVESMRRQLIGELQAAQRSRQAITVQAEALRRSNRDLEQFAYVASHDLQEPLRKVASFCQLLDRRYGTDVLDERGRQYIGFAVDGAKRMQQLINDLLAFSRVGRNTDAFVEVPLDGALARALGDLSVLIEDSGAEVTAGDLPTVSGDPVLLSQLFQNLVGNAVKFRGDAPPRVTIGATRTAEGWELYCHDDGIGIEPQYAEKIFVIFQRLHGRDSYAGTGIGLALCRKIVEFHGGRIWLDDTVSAGTTFRWTLPSETVTALPGGG